VRVGSETVSSGAETPKRRAGSSYDRRVTVRWSALRIRDPGLVSLRSAARAAIVMPAVFAIADEVIADPQVATFAAFGSFAMLVLVEFGGPIRIRLAAYASLALVGAANISIGTLCSRHGWLAAAVMAVVGFAILFSGIVSGYFSAAGTAALLTFILAAMIPAPLSALPTRLEGWALAAGAAVAAHFLIWPLRVQVPLRAEAARAAAALADLAAAELDRGPDALGDHVREAGQALRALRRRYLATPHKTSGPTGPQAALGSLVDELEWVLSQLAPPAQMPALDVCPDENARAVGAVVAGLRATASTLEGRDEEPDLERLRETRDSLARAFARRIPELPFGSDDDAVRRALQSAFRIRVLSGTTEQALVYALTASGRPTPDVDDPRAVRARRALRATEQATVEHSSPRDVWFRNSLRGAAGLAIAVYVAQRSGVQHGFWVALGTLSVLRSNALGTGWSIVTALAGTAVGIAVGAALVLAIGTHAAVLWAVLPLAVLLGSYAPRAISFAAGQAGFTVVLFVLFNIIQPVGWRVGLVRIEDVGIGFAVSLGVGLLFWPRGAAALLRENIAFSYARNADYVAAAERELVDGARGDASAEAAAAAAAAHRLDDAYRQSLAERSARDGDDESVAALVAGAARVRRVAQSLESLAHMRDAGEPLAACAANLDAEVNAVRSWYVTLGDALMHETTSRRRTCATPTDGGGCSSACGTRCGAGRRRSCGRRSTSSGPPSTSTRSGSSRTTCAGTSRVRRRRPTPDAQASSSTRSATESTIRDGR
jgi:uncharacterized membrane protein YccC